MSKLTKEAFRKDLQYLSSDKLQKKYSIGIQEINELNHLKGQQLEDRISKLFMPGGSKICSTGCK